MQKIQAREYLLMGKCLGAWRENERGKEGCMVEGELRRENRGAIEIGRDSSAVGRGLGPELHASTK